jgi:hypothetical protein
MALDLRTSLDADNRREKQAVSALTQSAVAPRVNFRERDIFRQETSERSRVTATTDADYQRLLMNFSLPSVIHSTNGDQSTPASATVWSAASSCHLESRLSVTARPTSPVVLRQTRSPEPAAAHYDELTAFTASRHPLFGLIFERSHARRTADQTSIEPSAKITLEAAGSGVGDCYMLERAKSSLLPLHQLRVTDADLQRYCMASHQHHRQQSHRCETPAVGV